MTGFTPYLLLALAEWTCALLLLRLLRYPSGRCPEAESRALALLGEVLSPNEREQLESRGYLEISSPSVPCRVYRVPNRREMVWVYERDRAIMRLCLEPVQPLPDAEMVLIHKLMIEGNEEYLRLANRFAVTRAMSRYHQMDRPDS